MKHIAQDRAAQGQAEVSTTSASICWIRPSYTYPDESSRVVVYWVKSQNMFGCYVDMRWWKYIWLHVEYVVGSSLPFCFVVCSAMWFSLLRWSSTCWCEQMRGTPVTNREVMVPLLSRLDLGSSFYVFC